MFRENIVTCVDVLFSEDIKFFVVQCCREPALLVAPTALQPEDQGSVIIGGRLSLRGDPLFRKSEQVREKLNVRLTMTILLFTMILYLTVR